MWNEPSHERLAECEYAAPGVACVSRVVVTMPTDFPTQQKKIIILVHIIQKNELFNVSSSILLF